MKILWFFIFIFLLNTVLSCKEKEYQNLLFVGSFTDKKLGKGIHVFEFNNETGEASLKYTVDSIMNTSFLRLSPNGKYLYSVVDSQMDYHGKVASFSIDSLNQSIQLLNMLDCGGRNPAHLEIDKTGKYLINSNYTDPSLSVFKIKNDGSLTAYNQLIIFKDSSIINVRQESAHIHSSNFSPDGGRLFAQDLGSDKIRRFKVVKNENEIRLKKEKPIQVNLGSGPRHFAFHPNGKFGYGIAELSGKVTAYNFIDGNLEYLEDYESYKEKQDIYRSADIHISPDGKFLYASNRGPKEDSIVIFSIDLHSGKLKLVAHQPTYGEHPRNFIITPNGKFLLVANQFSDKIVIFCRDYKTGKLRKLPHEILVVNPSSLQMRAYEIFAK